MKQERLEREMSIPRLSTELIKSEGTPIVRVHGEIDLYSVPEFEDVLKCGMEMGTSVLIVDLTDISYIDSAGLGSLLMAFKTLGKRDAKLHIVATPGRPGVRKILEITRLDTVMSIFNTLKDALESVKQPKAA